MKLENDAGVVGMMLDPGYDLYGTMNRASQTGSEVVTMATDSGTGAPALVLAKPMVFNQTAEALAQERAKVGTGIGVLGIVAAVAVGYWLLNKYGYGGGQ